MKILLTNNHLHQFGGSETWTLTMARELIRRGFDVGVYTRQKGVISDLLIDYIDDDPKDYDLALINHASCAHVDARKKIFTSHGLFDAIESPPPGMDAYVAVSENVQKRYDMPHLIKNPIDTNLFAPTSDIGETPERILAITYPPIPYPHFKPSRTEETMPELINKADLVVTIGRGVLEAMSCARNILSFDIRPNMGYKADGYIDSLEYLTGNVGGQYRLGSFDWATEMAKYKKEHGERNRGYVIKHHDVRDIVNKYLNLL